MRLNEFVAMCFTCKHIPLTPQPRNVSDDIDADTQLPPEQWTYRMFHGTQKYYSALRTDTRSLSHTHKYLSVHTRINSTHDVPRRVSLSGSATWLGSAHIVLLPHTFLDDTSVPCGLCLGTRAADFELLLLLRWSTCRRTCFLITPHRIYRE